ncbi:MAG: hypothetical protein ACRENH_03430, partial [Gemmatimonadaceae bacterium]
MTAAAVPRDIYVPAVDKQFRICPVTARKIDRQAEQLIKVNAVVSVVALLIGATAALLLALTRWQAVHLL